MTRRFMVMLPVGMGKTRLVWRRILRGQHSLARMNRKIRGTLISGPNNRVREVWLRELALLLRERRWIDLDEHDLRSHSGGWLAERLEEQGFELPEYLTFRDLAATRRRTCRFLVLDEWHKMTKALHTQCEVGGRWFLKNGGVKEGVFFVSATPVNPVLEEDQDRAADGEPASDVEFAESLSEGRRRALAVLQAFSDRKEPLREDGVAFKDLLSKLGVELYPISLSENARRWQLPGGLFGGADGSLLDKLRQSSAQELDYFRVSLEPEGARSWSAEYAYAVGLIQTDKGRRRGSGRSYRIVSQGTRGKKRCFGKKYVTLHTSPNGSIDAGRWLVDEHGREPRLLAILRKMGVIKKSGDDYALTRRNKALIFCVHQGVGLGLRQALVRSLGNGAAARAGVRTTLSGHESSTTERRIDKAFNEPGNPFILITTDAYSESVDLHGNCNVMIHYELPWSPLRLFQRIGRLTRLKTGRSGKVAYNEDVRIGHVIMPGSVEEERVNRLHRRIQILRHHDLWPRDYRRDRQYREQDLVRGLMGDGPSLHYQELVKGRA